MVETKDGIRGLKVVKLAASKCWSSVNGTSVVANYTTFGKDVPGEG
jgi:hypothetical protein